MDTQETPPSLTADHWLNIPTLISLIALLVLSSHSTLAQAQSFKDPKELMRLRDKAEEAMSVGDPQTAASNTGKAALLASLMAKEETRQTFRSQLESLEAMFRTQEQVYRAIALFQQSGEHVPASSGVCQTIILASTHRMKAEKLFSAAHATDSLFESLPSDLQEWKEIIEELQTEFGCIKKMRKQPTGH